MPLCYLNSHQALIFVMPLLGFGYILTLVVQPAVASLANPLAERISEALAAVITSTQVRPCPQNHLFLLHRGKTDD